MHVGPGHELFGGQFFELVAKALRPGGAMCIQAESVWFQQFSIQRLIDDCHRIFKGSASYAWTTVPTYPRHVSFTSNIFSVFINTCNFPFFITTLIK